MHRLSGWPGEERETLDLEPFMKERLKASLLDALFAPEIAGGFKRLYGRDLDEAIGEVFKEVLSARRLSQKFVARLTKMKSGAQAEITKTVEAHKRYCDSLLQVSKELLKIPEFRSLQTFQPGKIFEKTNNLVEVIRVRIKSLEKDELFAYFNEMLQKAQSLLILQRKLSDEDKIRNLIKEIAEATSDKEQLQGLLSAFQKIESIEDEIKKPPTFYTAQLNDKVKKIFQKLIKAKTFHQEARDGAKRYATKLETIKDSIKSLESVITVLAKKQKIGEEKHASITKLGKKAYTLVPIQLLVQDPSFSSLSEQPIPKGSEIERKQYLKALVGKHDALLDFYKKEKYSQRKFTEFKTKDLVELSQDERELEMSLKNAQERINTWTSEVVAYLSAFIGKPEKTPLIQNEKDVSELFNYVTSQVDIKKTEYLKNMNEKLEPLSRTIRAFEEKEVKKISTELERERLELPAYKTILGSLDTEKETWRKNDVDFLDYQVIPNMVDETIPILNFMINESVDERKLKEAVASTYNEIIEKLKERKLIEAIAEISKESVQARVKYKGRGITHPAGAEKAFFSLAILSALGYYFGMPILIDEVANNLDSKNLPAFFNLVIELKSEKQLQYLLSIKKRETSI